MKPGVRSSILAIIAIVSGLLVLIGYFLDIPGISEIREILLQWAMMLAAVALLVGVFNLSRVHWVKITRKQPRAGYSLLLLVALFGTLIVGLWFGPDGDYPLWIFNYLQLPVEISLLAVLALVLVYSGGRMLYRRLNWFSVLFITSALVTVLGVTLLALFDIPGLQELSAWLSQTWAVGGARGLLLGVALGTIATGIRILLGADRPYEG